jgi:hypothetical protein
MTYLEFKIGSLTLFAAAWFTLGIMWLHLSYREAAFLTAGFYLLNVFYIVRDYPKPLTVKEVYQPIKPLDLTKPPQGHNRQLYIDGTPIKPVTATGVGEAMAGMFTDAQDITIEVDYTPPPAEFSLTVYGPAADYFRNIIAKDQLFRLEGISFEDSLEVTFKEVED